MEFFYQLLLEIRNEFKELTYRELVFPCLEVFEIDKNAFDIFINEIEEKRPFSESKFKIEDLYGNQFLLTENLNKILENHFGSEEFMQDQFSGLIIF